MKHKTAELTGALLDKAVTIANSGHNPSWEGERPPIWSRNWALAGMIIHRELIDWYVEGRGDAEPVWVATADGVGGFYARGPTPLIAAMRAFVASKLGDEVEL